MWRTIWEDKMMSISLAVRTDHDIQAAVQEELEWTPDVDAAGVGVAVEAGVVSLSGEVDSHAERLAAMRAGQAAWASPHVTDVDNLIVVKAAY
jgi:osmotically-inducible protein OsmY